MKLFFILFITAITLIFAPFVSAQGIQKTNIFEAKVVTATQKATVIEITQGDLKGKQFPMNQFRLSESKNPGYSVGDRVIVSYSKDPQGKEVVYIVDYVRRFPLMILAALFLLTVIIVGRWKGIFSFIGMILSFLIIGQFIVPQIILGNNPIIISLLGALFIIPITFYISHGINKHTTVAVISTFCTLLITGILAYIFVIATKLTGFAAEEATYIQAMGGSINIRSLLLAGIIIGAMGVLDDITISQTSIVEKLAKTNPKLSFRELFNLGMEVGRDHISSLVNTLILVYAGAALPLFLLFYNSQMSYGQVVNQEIIATEIVRTLVSSIGIITAVPIATFLAVFVVKKYK